MTSIPMLDLRREYEYMKSDIDAAIQKCLGHQKWILGPEVKELEQTVAGYLNAKFCVGASSGTEALVLGLRALAIQRKGQEYFDKTDKIITTPFTFTATGDAILRSGATPVFVDIEPGTYNLDVNKVEECIKQVKGVVGIIPVHLYGQVCDMGKILELAQRHHLFVVEDVAQAFGATWQGKKAGSIGDIGAFSFFPSKNLGGFGDGGMVSTNDPALADLVTMLLKHGGKDKYNVDHIGYNARLDTLQAAVLLAKMKFIDEFNRNRQKLAGEYGRRLGDLKTIVLPKNITASFQGEHVYHQFTVRVLNGRRDELQRYLKENGVDTMVYYPVLLNRMKVFQGRSEVLQNVTEAEKAVNEVLSLPVEPLFSGGPEIPQICDLITSWSKKS
ncbi:MAG: DegT/DnrJ/EryC1/StrS family aminotransferase [Candidatus Omnitrophica bacterium]|nr:DegT/DnrJ/EryC1/StrS family aminotransferase [Candidatus Omnitrophota bacterium]